MEFILISYPEFFAEESRIISSLMDKYSFVFHLRKPNAAPGDYDSFLRSIPDCFHNRIVAHNAYNLQEEFDLKGIHLASYSRDIVAEIKGIKSTSCHSLDEIRELNGQYDSLFLSPVFPSISKKGYKGNLKMSEVKEFLKLERKTKIIALGGIDESTLLKLSEYKFDGIAVLGAVWTDNPILNLEQIETNFLKVYLKIRK